MAGPDFVFGTIKSYAAPPGADGILMVEDGAAWRVRATDGDHDANSRLIERATRNGQLFISGDRRTGIIDRVAVPRALSALSVGPLTEGRYAVSFAGPPAVYYLLAARPWAETALALLRRSVQTRPALDQPDLLVSIDTVSAEVMDIRPAKRP